MNAPTKKAELLDALAKLELCLETPVVPGELERWTMAVQQAFAEVEGLLVEIIKDEHPQQIKQISEEDPGLLRRVAQLNEQDQANRDSLQQIAQQLKQLSNKVEVVEPDEARVEDRLEKFVEAGLAFIIQLRKQEAAIDTWLMEALDRDRGVVD